MPAYRKLVSVPLRLNGAQLRTMQELSQLAGFSLSTVTSVVVARGFLAKAPELAEQLVAAKKLRKRVRSLKRR